MSEAKDFFTKIGEESQKAEQSATGEAYSKLSTILEAVDEELREHMQELTVGEMKSVLKKLKDGETISEDDLKRLKLWVVGDAESYIKMENNFEDWKSELQRLVGEITGLKTDQIDIETILKLRGLLRDAIRTIADIFYFAQQKDRVERFDEATKEIDQGERLFLVRLLEQKISSPNF